MEFMNRGAAGPAAPARAAHNTEAGAPGGKRGGRWKESPMWLRVVWIVLLFSATALVIALSALLYIGGPDEADSVKKDQNQAVFLTNGQVYFGKIKNINSKFVDLQDIYYLNVNQQVQPSQQGQQAQNSITLVRLGCELHGPQDQMLINRDQVTFWENLKDDGQVSKAIKKWLDENPSGVNDCKPATTNTNNTDQQKP